MNRLVSAFTALFLGLTMVTVSEAPSFARSIHNRPSGVYHKPQSHFFHRQGNRAYYQGHRGYQNRRPGYRSYNGFWFPASAFLGAVIINGLIQNGTRGTGSHADWCNNRYRSYRYSDNTFQPYNGPRRTCR